MNGKDGNIVNELKEKIKLILLNFNDLKEENKKLKLENKRLIDDLKGNKKEIGFLEEKFEKVQLAKTILGSSEDTHVAKLKINRIVREIDKCIALLNK
ncbi:MAG: hypothetical protein JXB17_09555 [Bacteroidales bacterium]|nr:hypothetical protein [Bacteroidales bacterium]